MNYKTLAATTMAALVLAATSPLMAADLHSPEQAHTALKILASVYADMDEKLKNAQYDRLPHENQEFQEGSGAMRDAIADEPPEFKTSAQSALQKSLTDAQHVADVSKSHDPAQIKAAIDALAGSMHSLNALFPETVRAEPGSVPPPQHGGGPPKA